MATNKKQYANPFLKVKVSENAVSLYNRALALKAAGKLEAAVEKYEEAIQLKPDFVEAYYNKGNALRELRQFEKAISSFEIVISYQPNFALAFFNRGNIYKELGQLDLAIKDYDRATQIDPIYFQAFSNKALILKDQHQFKSALASFDKAIDLNPKFAEAYLNKGNLLKDINEFELALNCYNTAISLNPSVGDYYLNRGLLFIQNNKLEAALHSFQQASDVKEDSEWLQGLILQAKIYLCDWLELSEKIENCEVGIKQQNPVIHSFITAVLTDNPALQRQSSEIYTAKKFPSNNQLGVIPKRSSGEKVRLGYYSTDFYHHPVSIWLAEQLENHDKSKFELYAFCLKDVQDPMQERLKAAFDHWTVVDGMSDLEVASLSRQLKIDIALDLNGHTQYCRSGIFAARAAPIQVNHLGMPGTMGADYIDYIISDPYSVTQGNRAFITEKAACVPCAYTYDRQRQISEEILSREQFGLPESGFIFTCQNGCHKITPEVFNIWMEILKAVPGSVLWLLKPNDTALKNLIKEANARGVEAERLIFTAREVMPLDQEKARIGRYLASYKLADLFLDTWPFNAGTTAIDALWAGLPVLTKSGESLISRMATSALSAIEITELITPTWKAYQDMAVNLAKDSVMLDKIRAKLKSNRLSTALFDPVANTRYIEKAYLEMYRKYVNDERHEQFTICN